MAAVNVANNPIGSYPVKVTKEGSGASTVNIQHVNVDTITPITVTGVATEAKQDVQITLATTLDSKITACNTSAVVISKTAITGASPSFATVGTSSASALASNASRKGLVLTNTSTNTISLGLGNPAVLNSGITLNASGGVWVMDEYTFTTVEIFAIASSASSNLAIQEFS